MVRDMSPNNHFCTVKPGTMKDVLWSSGINYFNLVKYAIYLPKSRKIFSAEIKITNSQSVFPQLIASFLFKPVQFDILL